MADPRGSADLGVVLSALIRPVYAPIVAGTFGLALLLPVLPIYLTESGLSLGTSSMVLAAVGLGASLGGLPAGAGIARFGERAVMFVSLLVAGVTTALLGLTDAVVVLIALRLATGAANAGLRLSRQTYVTRHVGVGMRGRALSTIGGSFRMSLFVGPLLGGFLADTIGFAATFAVAGAITAAGTLPPLRRRPGDDDRPVVADGVDGRRLGLVSALRTHWRLLAVASVVPILTMTVREGRNVVIPLIGDELELSTTAVGALVTVGTLADLALFPVAGYLMDRFGRLASMVPSYSLIAAGLFVLGTADTTVHVVIASAIIGIGNGLGSGTLLTMGSDLAPAEAPGQFLAGFAVLQDLGKVAGPLVVGLVGDAAGLGAAATVLGVVMVATIAWLVLVIGDTSRRAATT